MRINSKYDKRGNIINIIFSSVMALGFLFSIIIGWDTSNPINAIRIMNFNFFLSILLCNIYLYRNDKINMSMVYIEIILFYSWVLLIFMDFVWIVLFSKIF